MHTNVMHDNAIAFMIHQCREAAAVSLLVIQFSNRATSLIVRSFKLVRLSVDASAMECEAKALQPCLPNGRDAPWMPHDLRPRRQMHF